MILADVIVGIAQDSKHRPFEGSEGVIQRCAAGQLLSTASMQGCRVNSGQALFDLCMPLGSSA
jgi:hypothetical protein